jgi:hypothetical protein
MILFIVSTKEFFKVGASRFENFRVKYHKFHTLLSLRLSHIRLDCRKFYTRWFPKMFVGVHKCFGFFLEQYYKADVEFPNHIVWVAHDETWIWISILKPKYSQSSGCTRNHQRSQKEVSRNVCLLKAEGNYFLVQESSSDGEIHVTRKQSVKICIVKH